MTKFLTIITLFLVFSNEMNAQKDSLYRRHLGISIGYKDYSSVNEIFNPYIYSATSAMFSVELVKIKKKSKFAYYFDYARLNRHPKDLPVPAFYDLVSTENGLVYRTYVDQQNLSKVLTNYFHFRVAAAHRITSHLLTDDALSLGLNSENLFILSPKISDPEIIALSISPGIVYEVFLKHGFSLTLDNQLSLLALTVQRPYSGAEPQLDEKKSLHFYTDYVLHNSKLSSVNCYFLFSSQITIEKEVSNRIAFMARYSMRFQEMKKSKRMVSAETALNLGVIYKFK